MKVFLMYTPLRLGLVAGVILAGLCAWVGFSMLAGAPGAGVEKKAPANLVRPTLFSPDLRASMVPHKAIYKIEMVEKRSSSQVTNISGDMYFEWKPGCEAWATDHRFNLHYEYADSPHMHITSDFATYETFDGKRFAFNSRRHRSNELYEELRGEATTDPDSHTGHAVFSMPEGLSFDLPQGTLFPMMHTLAVLQAAKEGKRFYNTTIFDGSDDQGPNEVNAFIGAPVNAMALMTPSSKIDTSLINNKAWKIRLAFFPSSSKEPESDYEMDVIFHENGVISDMLVEYRDFSVVQKLVALEPVKPTECHEKQKN